MATTKGNVIVGQSGGPTAVINSSLAGVYKTAKDRGAKKIYGMLHGIQGLLEERYVDLSKHITSDLDIELLKRTPSSYLGSCRYKLPEIKENTEIYDKIFGILDSLAVNHDLTVYDLQRISGQTDTAFYIVFTAVYRTINDLSVNTRIR